MNKLSDDALELIKNKPQIQEGIKSMNFENIHLIAEIMIKGKNNVGVALLREIESQTKGTN